MRGDIYCIQQQWRPGQAAACSPCFGIHWTRKMSKLAAEPMLHKPVNRARANSWFNFNACQAGDKYHHPCRLMRANVIMKIKTLIKMQSIDQLCGSHRRRNHSGTVALFVVSCISMEQGSCTWQPFLWWNPTTTICSTGPFTSSLPWDSMPASPWTVRQVRDVLTSELRGRV